MQFSKILLVITLVLAIQQSRSQSEPPKGFSTGSITLADGSNLSGLIKDNMRGDASIIFFHEAAGKKKVYDGRQLNSMEIEGVKFICINNDFFKVLSDGELNFLQKSSNVRGKVFYHGMEAFVSTGTDGKIGEYFIYRKTNRELKLITKKNLSEVISTSFDNYAAAVEKAQTVNGDLSQLKLAVDVYNKRTIN